MDRGTGNETEYGLERDLEGACGRVAKTAGWFHRKYKGPGRRSHPDRLFARGGLVFWVEFKRRGEQPTELQWLEICAMRAAGLDVYWTDNRYEFENILASYAGPA